MIEANPHFVKFDALGSKELGYLSVCEGFRNVPFEIKRTFWAYFTPDSIMRGGHAHFETEMLLIAVAGKIILNTEMLNSEKKTFVLERPDVGVYMPKMCWHTMQYSHNAVQLVIASTLYNEEDYIRDYKSFLQYGSKNS